MQLYKISWNIPLAFSLVLLIPPCTFIVCFQHRSQNLIYTIHIILFGAKSFSFRVKREVFAVSSEMLPDLVCLWTLPLLPLCLSTLPHQLVPAQHSCWLLHSDVTFMWVWPSPAYLKLNPTFPKSLTNPTCSVFPMELNFPSTACYWLCFFIVYIPTLEQTPVSSFCLIPWSVPSICGTQYASQTTLMS